jgi:hypothetical protein
MNAQSLSLSQSLSLFLSLYIPPLCFVSSDSWTINEEPRCECASVHLTRSCPPYHASFKNNALLKHDELTKKGCGMLEAIRAANVVVGEMQETSQLAKERHCRKAKL